MPRSLLPLVVEWVIIFFIALGLTAAGLVTHVFSFFAGFVLATLSFPILKMRKLPPTDAGYIIGPRSVSLTDAGIREKSDRHDSFFPWKSVQRVEFTEAHVFVMVASIAAIIVPRRAFASDEERNQFVEEVKRRSAT